MHNIPRKLRKSKRLFFFTVASVCSVLGFFLTQTRGLGEEILVQIWPTIVIKVTATQALGYFLIGIGLVSWTAFLVSIIMF
jgi:hypothetical protein